MLGTQELSGHHDLKEKAPVIEEEDSRNGHQELHQGQDTMILLVVRVAAPAVIDKYKVFTSSLDIVKKVSTVTETKDDHTS